MKKITLLAIIAFTAVSISAVAQKSNKKEMKKVLFVVTSNDKLGNTGEKTGFWSEEFAAPYYELLDQGVEITIASPLGGQPPIDPKSADPSSATEDTKRFDADKVLQEKLKNTLKLSTVNQKDYDAVFYPGGHGPLWDLVQDKNSISLIESFYTHNKPIAFVCHAPAVLKNVKVLSGGEKMRCMFSRMMLQHANFLMFDEPTNHLDLESITALNNGMIKFPGVILFACRDHQVVQTTANRIIEFLPNGSMIDKINLRRIS